MTRPVEYQRPRGYRDESRGLFPSMSGVAVIYRTTKRVVCKLVVNLPIANSLNGTAERVVVNEGVLIEST